MPPAPSPATCTEPAEPAPAAGGLTLDSTFSCAALHARVMPIRCCLLRQAANRTGRTQDSWRGQAGLYPSCSHRCVQGAAIRAAVSGASAVRWQGAGPGKRFEHSRRDVEAVALARRRLQLVGLLDVPPCIDHPPGEAIGARCGLDNGTLDI